MERVDVTGQKLWDVFTGLLIIGFGFALLMGNFDLADVRPFLNRYWPLLMILIGLRLAVVRRDDAALAGGIFWMATGALFFLSLWGWINVPVRNLIWPVLVIWFGVATLFKASDCGHPADNGGKS